MTDFRHLNTRIVKNNLAYPLLKDIFSVKPPVLHLPDSKGRFHLYSDTRKFATGSTLCQIQNGKPILIDYTTKRLSKVARNYSITELEMCRLTTNIASFVDLLKE